MSNPLNQNAAQNAASTKVPSVFGGSCIIAGVCVGAGMLALPSAGAGAWTWWSSAALILTMVCMTLSGLLLLQVYKAYEMRASFNTVTRDVLGPVANIVNNVAVYFVGGILLYAYISTLGDIFGGMLGADTKLFSVLACVLFGGIVWHSTRAVDRVSVLLIIFMVLSFIFAVGGLAFNIQWDVLSDANSRLPEYAPYALGMLPVALASFGYHHSVTTMRAYYREEKKAGRAIMGGMVIALLIYLLWIFSVFGNLPRHDFAPVIAADGKVDVLLQSLGQVIEFDSVKRTMDAFALAAILSSFIGVGLGVFDFLADFFGFADDRAGRTKTWAVTFVPPLVFSLLAPFGFVKAIGYAGAVAAVWTCIVPALLALKVHARDAHRIHIPGGVGAMVLVLIFGCATAVLHLLNVWGHLPTFTG